MDRLITKMIRLQGYKLYIYIKSPFVVICSLFIRHSFVVHLFVMFFLRGNNSALGGHRAPLKVANESYCNVVLIFGVIWSGKRCRPTKKCFFLVGYQKIYFCFFWLPYMHAAAVHAHGHHTCM